MSNDNGDCNPLTVATERAFWLEIRSLLLRAVCLIEKEKLQERQTTADLRKAGKNYLTKDKT